MLVARKLDSGELTEISITDAAPKNTDIYEAHTKRNTSYALAQWLKFSKTGTEEMYL